MSDSLRKSLQAHLGGDEITVQELTTAQIADVMDALAKEGYSPHILDVLMAHDIPLEVVVLSSGVTEETLMARTPTELGPLYDKVVEVNPSLAVLTERLREIMASSLGMTSGDSPVIS
ncbi:MAG: hypothetical protein ACI8PB_002902 [Desulforhopalus sp.]|jgi:hypothetical protein